jgi:hypothetical protein
LRSERRTLPKATPALAQRIWARQQRPSARRVARALQQAGYRVHFVTVNRWRAQGWRAKASDHPLETARSQLEAVAPLVTGDPETTLADLIDDPAHSDFDELTDGEVLRRAAREAAIATALVWKAMRQSSAMLVSPRNPSRTMRIFSSAEYCRRVALRISLTVFSALSGLTARALIVASSALR